VSCQQWSLNVSGVNVLTVLTRWTCSCYSQDGCNWSQLYWVL